MNLSKGEQQAQSVTSYIDFYHSEWSSRCGYKSIRWILINWMNSEMVCVWVHIMTFDRCSFTGAYDFSDSETNTIFRRLAAISAYHWLLCIQMWRIKTNLRESAAIKEEHPLCFPTNAHIIIGVPGFVGCSKTSNLSFRLIILIHFHKTKTWNIHLNSNIK